MLCVSELEPTENFALSPETHRERFPIFILPIMLLSRCEGMRKYESDWWLIRFNLPAPSGDWSWRAKQIGHLNVSTHHKSTKSIKG